MANYDQPISQKTEAQSAFVRGVIYILEEWRVLTIVFERTFTSNMAATVPWIAPLIPASFALKNAAEKLQVQNGVEYIIAASIEGLGMSVTSTAFELWDWSDKNKETKLSAPILISIGTIVFYVVIVISVNVGLDLGWAEWLIKAMLSLLSIPAVVTLALRSQHSRRIAEKESAKIETDKKQAEEKSETLRLAEITLEAQRREDEIAQEAQRKQMEFDMEQRRLDAETRRQIKMEKARTSETNSGTSRTSKIGSGTDGTQKPTFRTGRKSTHKQAVFDFIETYVATHGNVPSFSEVEQELKLPQSTASRLRGEWLKERGNQHG